MRHDQQAGEQFVGMLADQAHFRILLDVSRQQYAVFADTDAQHAALVVVVRLFRAVVAVSRVQHLELHAVPVPAFAIPAAPRRGR